LLLLGNLFCSWGLQNLRAPSLCGNHNRLAKLEEDSALFVPILSLSIHFGFYCFVRTLSHLLGRRQILQGHR